MTYDQSLDGSANGSGGQFNYSTAQVLDAGQRRAAAEAKAAADPSTLTDADLADLPAAAVSELMAAGRLVHLGLGARRKPAPGRYR